MLVTVLGAAGRTGRLVVDELLARGYEVRAVVRRPEQAARLRERGADDVLSDIAADNEDLVSLMQGTSAVINAAAASSPEPGAAEVVDRDAVLACIRAAEQARVSRFVQISSMFADRAEHGPEFLRAVLRAKQVADRALETSSLVSTVVRPAGLTDEAATGRVEVGARLTGSTIPRADVATVAVASLTESATENRAFDVRAGGTELDAALATLDGAREEGVHSGDWR